MTRLTTIRGRLVAGGLACALLLVGVVGGFLLWNQSSGARAAVDTQGAAHALMARQLVQVVGEPELAFAAQDLGAQPALSTALQQPSPAVAVSALVNAHAAIVIPGANVLIFDRGGTVVASLLNTPEAQPRSTLASVQDAAFGLAPSTTAVSGVETQPDGTLAVDAAIGVRSSSGAVVGAVLYSAPLIGIAARYAPAAGGTVVVIDRAGTATRISTQGNASTANLPADVLHSARAARDVQQPWVSGVYAGASGDVVGAFVPLTGPGGDANGVIGVEMPLGAVATQADEGRLALFLIAVTAGLVILALATFFVDRYLARPVARLERDVAAIAAGDYDTPIVVTRDDEVGRLARGVDGMRAAIAGAIHRRDKSELQLREVSKALTATASGLPHLSVAVENAAAAIAGNGAAAEVVPVEVNGLIRRLGDSRLLDAGQCERVNRGEIVHETTAAGVVTALPMMVQDALVAVLAVVTDTDVDDSTLTALQTLANNAAVAVANTRTLEQERDAMKVLRELHSMKTDFLSIAQHELRTPVHAILGYLELLTMAWNNWSNDDRRMALADIEASCRQLAAVVENIVHFSLLGSDAPPTAVRAVEVAGAVTRAIEAVTQVYRSGLPVTVDVQADPLLTVRANEDRLVLALRCLLDNAVKFSPPGSAVHVAARAEGGMVAIDIIDDGYGIPDDAMDRVFDRFYQADSGANRAHNGMGLGLAVVRRMCEEHGAAIKVRSVVGHGSCFTLLWPAA